VATSAYFAVRAGPLAMTVKGPGSWDPTWGEWQGHETQSYTLDVYQTAMDVTRPWVSVVTPVLGSNLPLGAPMVVNLSVTDDTTIASVVVGFDVNGDGDTDDLQENLAATNLGAGSFRATFPALEGIPGRRIIRVLATDTAFNGTEKFHPVGVGGVGAGEQRLVNQDDGFPALGWGATRPVYAYGPIAIPSQGRLTFRVVATPSIRKQGTNLERHDPVVQSLSFNGTNVALSPVCNDWDEEPAVAVSVWETPGPGTLNFEVLGGAVYNIWGEFDGIPVQNYNIELLFQPGPTVTQVVPAAVSVAGHDLVTVRGSGFSPHAVVLFNEVPGNGVAWSNATQLTCRTPPGVTGAVTVTVLNDDPDNQPWNYGGPYGLFGRLTNGVTYQAPSGTLVRSGERFVGSWKGYFPPVGDEGAQQYTNLPGLVPAAGRMRFETYAFVPILYAIPGPYGDSENLDWHNESTAVRSLTASNGGGYGLATTHTELNYAYDPVVSESTCILPASAAGTGTLHVVGPATWNAFWREFGEFVMSSAPAQQWTIGAWYAPPPGFVSLSPTGGSTRGGATITLTGTNFADGLRVFFNELECTSVVVQGVSSATCVVPPGTGGSAVVRLEMFGMSTSLTGRFSFIPQPCIRLDGNLAFGAVTVGRTSMLALAICNDGDATLHVSSIAKPAGFAGSFTGTIAPASNQSVTISFTPTAVTNYGGTIVVGSDATNAGHTIVCSGLGAPFPALSISRIGRAGTNVVVEWTCNRSNLYCVVESCTPTQTMPWAAATSTQEWWSLTGAWTNAPDAPRRLLYRVRASE
jgi:hypothetical protein